MPASELCHVIFMIEDIQNRKIYPQMEISAL